MYNYKQDLKDIIDAIGDDDASLASGVLAIQAAARLIKQETKPAVNSNDKAGVLTRPVAVTSHLLMLLSNLQTQLPLADNVYTLINQTWTDAQQAYDAGTAAEQRHADPALMIFQSALSLIKNIFQSMPREEKTAETSSQAQVKPDKFDLAASFTPKIEGLLSTATANWRGKHVFLADDAKARREDLDTMYHNLDLDQQQANANSYLLLQMIIDWLIKTADETFTAIQNQQSDAHTRLVQSLMEYGNATDEHRKAILARSINKYAIELKDADDNIISASTLDTLTRFGQKPKTVAKVVEKSAVDVSLKPTSFYAQRKLNGMALFDDKGNQRTFFPESAIHSYDYQTGDILQADYRNHQYHINKVEGHRDEVPFLQYGPIDEFKYAVVEERDGRFMVSHNIQNELLMINDSPVSIAIDRKFYRDRGIKVENGTLCDLAWYRTDPRLDTTPNEAVSIRWVHKDEKPRQTKTTSKSSNKSDTAKHVADSQTSLESLLDLDLHGQKVAVAVGHGLNHIMVEQLIKKYNGTPRVFDAFNIRKGTFAKIMHNIDIVILVSSFANHSSSWNVVSALRQTNTKFAVSNNLAASSIARALYRAEHRLPAYESGTSKVDYPMIEIHN